MILHVRYYLSDGTYKDHGRNIYQSIPKVGDIISPFLTINGKVVYKVTEVKFPENDSCMEIYYEDLGEKNVY